MINLLKRSCFLILVVALLLITTSPATAEINWLEWKEAPPLPPWTIVFSFSMSQEHAFGELIIGQNQGERPLIQGSTIYSDLGTDSKTETLFFEAVYLSDEKPEKFIEMMWRGKGKYPSVIGEDELNKIIDLIRENKNWIILEDDKVFQSPF